MQILPVLANRAEVVLWTDQAQVAPEAERVARVAHYDPAAPPWRSINDGAFSIYHLGNQSDFHGGIWQVSVRQPGVVLLHDLRLHDFFYTFWVHYRKDRISYLGALERWYGGKGRRAGEAFLRGGLSPESMAQEYPLTREATRGALGVITHARGAFEDLGEAPVCPLAALDFPYVPAPQARYSERTAIRSASARPPYRVVVFGYLNRNRRLGPMLEALAGLSEREQFRLEICGQLWDEGHIRAEIERLGLLPLVKLLGFLPDGLVEQKLSTADLAINLRYPSMGEASLSQLQFWDYGLPTLVTSTGWYASLPDDTTAFVRPDHEVEDIQTHLRAFLADPGAFRAMGERGRKRLAKHDPERYVDAMIQFATDCLRQSPRAAALSLAGRVGNDLSGWLHAPASAYLLDRASQEIATLCEGKSGDQDE